jgi:hypothetical protein
LPEAIPHRALAAQYEAALQAYHAFFRGSGTDAEADEVNDAVKAVALKIIAVPGTDISIMRLKARVYLWAESTDLKRLAAEGGDDWQAEAALASLFRDLGVADLEVTPGPATMADRVPAQHDEAAGENSEILTLAAESRQLRVKISSIRMAFEPLEVAFEAIRKANGYKKAEEWGHQSEYWALVDELEDLYLRETNLVDSMIKLQPKTPAGIAAVAAAFKADQDHFWKNPESDRDWHISLLTRFLDGLIDPAKRPASPIACWRKMGRRAHERRRPSPRRRPRRAGGEKQFKHLGTALRRGTPRDRPSLARRG